MNILKFSIAMIAIASISACSNAPSESDAKKVVLSMLGDCSHLSLESFEKTNGIAIGNQGYKIDVAYSVKVTALPESKNMVEGVPAKLAEIDSRLEKATAEYDRINSEDTVISDKLSKEYGKPGKNFVYELQEERSALRDAKLNPAHKLVESLKEEKERLIKSVTTSLRDRFAKECPNVNAVLYANLYKDADAAQYAKDFTKEFSGSMPMIKTDNGWQAAL